MGHKIPKLGVQNAERGVVVKGLDPDKLALLVKLIGKIEAVPVCVAADIVQHLQIGDGFQRPAVHAGQCNPGMRHVVGAQVVQIHALRLHHEAALHSLAVRSDELHRHRLCHQIRHVQQLRHSAHGAVAAVHPGAVVDLGDGMVVEDGSAVHSDRNHSDLRPAAQLLLRLLGAQRLPGLGIEL